MVQPAAWRSATPLPSAPIKPAISEAVLPMQAASKAAADMADPEKKAEWQAVADASHGKFKTALFYA